MRKPGVRPNTFIAPLRPRAVAAVQYPKAYGFIQDTPLYVQDAHGSCLCFAAYNAASIMDRRKGIYRPINNAEPSALYVELGGMPADIGLNPQTLINRWMAAPIGGYKLANIEALALDDFDGMEQSIIDTGFCFMTAMLTQANMTQYDWANIAGSPADGGHCFLGTGVIGSRFEDATWGETCNFEKDWFAVQGMNAWHCDLVAS
jgi:hypothetical protein